jgi:5-methylcytosine-specific restriction endonuclease McrA
MKLKYNHEIHFSPSIKDLLEVFIGQNFNTLTVPFIAQRLKTEPNTIIQRLRRDPDKLFITDDSKPKNVKVKPGFRSIVLLANRYKCRYCLKDKSDNELEIQLRWPNIDSDNYNNLITICEACQQGFQQNLEQNPKKITEFGTEDRKSILSPEVFEYKQIWIENRPYIPPGEIHATYSYYVYHDLAFGQTRFNWNYIAKEGIYPDNILSKTQNTIFDAFGKDGWELIQTRILTEEENIAFFDSQSTHYEAIFKRKKGAI